ncbi:MocR-like pyridoxine biosynthesis transcription factor PdxR [Dongia deserti]|uniref:MocR-like pyridoxine biosynthesis transcription factor PdxR n=1 Tax=Dongia deserti TaxID=2268030 RepID=UPI000E65296B|nr:PLP-dependent aminotransferase family protein [Dongia deserti]
MARKAGTGSLLPLELDGDSASPLFQRLYRQLRQAVLEGRLKPGARLPATRVLADELGLSRNTVLAAYDQLASEGFLELRHRSGVFVAEDLPIARQDPQPAPPQPELGIRARDAASAGPVGADRRGGPRWPSCFATGVPDVSQFPFDLWTRLLARSWRRPAASLPIGGDPGGHPALRAAIASYIGEARGIACHPDHVLVVSGIRQAVDLACRLLLDPGDQVWMENPGYPGIRAVLAANACEVVGVPIDEEGLDVAMGRKVAGHARLVCVAPSHQFPLGVALSLQRRLMLLDWAREAGAWILEDDYDSEYRYAGRPLAALKSLDKDNRVIYVGTLSKLLFPSLRLGYLVAPPQLADAFRNLRTRLDDQPSMVAQPALAELFRSGHLAAHVRRMRQVYAARQRAFLDAADTHLKGLVAFRAEESGLHLVGRIGRRLGGRNDKALARTAAREGIQLAAVSDYDLFGDGPQGLMFGYAAAPEHLVAPALRRLKEIWT